MRTDRAVEQSTSSYEADCGQTNTCENITFPLRLVIIYNGNGADLSPEMHHSPALGLRWGLHPFVTHAPRELLRPAYTERKRAQKRNCSLIFVVGCELNFRKPIFKGPFAPSESRSESENFL